LRVWDQIKKARKIITVEALGCGELPEDRAKPVAQFGEALDEELLDRVSALGQQLARGRALTLNWKPSGTALAQLAKVAGFWLP
jgi:hypothetical protein